MHTNVIKYVLTCSGAELFINHEDDNSLVIKTTPTCSPRHLNVLTRGDKPANVP